MCGKPGERGDTVQVTMPKPYIKYKIISSSRSRDICYESVNGRTDGQGDYNIAPTHRVGVYKSNFGKFLKDQSSQPFLNNLVNKPVINKLYLNNSLHH